ncbi:MAG: 4-hydroxyphenylacetate 3-hydroxylase N-terminal domain-containing protein, partial [Pseudomonadota bacterium]
MTARTSAQFLDGIKDEREVWLGAKRIDVSSDPAMAGSLAGMAGYFDWQHQHSEDCLAIDPVTGEKMNASLILPRSREALDIRHRAFERFARYSHGMLGRTPDYVNVTLAGFTARRDIFVAGSDERYAQNIENFYREVVEKDLSMTHTIINPQIDKSIPDTMGINGDLTLKVVRRTKDSIIVRGAKILATLGPFADELYVYPGQPQSPDTDPAMLLSFSIPMGTKGLITLCRD